MLQLSAVWLILLLAAGGQESVATGLRRLQQSSAGCPVDNCSSGCMYSQKAWRCASCSSGYTRLKQGQACVCKAGSFLTALGCRPCTLNSYCPLQSNPKPCPGNLVTERMGAASLKSCANPPGYYFVANPVKPTALPCGPDTYSRGLRQQRTCTPCPSGFKTDPDNLLGTHTSSDVCKAPPGYYQQGDVAMPCPQGTFSSVYSGQLSNCTPCGTGLLTASTGSSSASQCAFLKEGYAAFTKQGLLLQRAATEDEFGIIVKAKLCPQGWWCPGGDPRGGGAPVKCTGSLRTQSEGAFAASQCVAPPGFRVVGGAAVECDDGYYKQGWNLLASCTACGLTPVADSGVSTVGWKSDRTFEVPLYDAYTSEANSILKTRGSAASCYIRKAMGTLKQSISGGLQALPCPTGFYGTSESKVYGTGISMCRSCPAHQVTSCAGVTDPATTSSCAARLSAVSVTYSPGVPAYFNSSACVHQPGFAWLDYLSGMGQLVSDPCPIGSYSSGGHNDTCAACPTNFVTPDTGSTNSSSCVAPPGYAGTSGVGVPCTDGSFKAAYSNSACTSCGGGSLWKSAATVNVTFFNRLTAEPTVVLARGSNNSCYIRQGMGVVDNAGVPTAVVCNSNNYGINATIRYGQDITPCTDCPTNMVTSCVGVTDPATKTACSDDLVAYKNAQSGGFFSPLVCKVLPGYGWTGGAAAALCLEFTYSVGGHRSPCTTCPVVAGPGFSTPNGSTSVTNCYILTPGYLAVNASDVPFYTLVSDLSTIAAAALCSLGYYCPGGKPWLVSPQQCGANLTTKTSLSDPGTGSINQTQCLAPPGYKCLDANCTSADQCADASYKSTYDRSTTCTSCGTNLTTKADAADDGLGSTSQTDCVAPAGFKCDNSSCDSASLCAIGTYKSAYSRSTTCTSCGTNLTTVAEGSTNQTQCVAPAGYKCDDSFCSSASLCPLGSWNNETSRATSCTSCGTLLTTIAEGSTAPTDCVAPPGYACTDAECTSGTLCASSTFQANYTRSTTCTSCGVGTWYSDPVPSAQTSCYIIGGQGIYQSGPDYTAVSCNNGTQYSQVDLNTESGAGTYHWNYTALPCTQCPNGQVTSCDGIVDPTVQSACNSSINAITVRNAVSLGFMNNLACVNPPGYGLSGGVSSPCLQCYYGPGGDDDICQPCGNPINMGVCPTTDLSPLNITVLVGQSSCPQQLLDSCSDAPTAATTEGLLGGADLCIGLP